MNLDEESRKLAEEIMARCLGDFAIKDEGMFQTREDVAAEIKAFAERVWNDGWIVARDLSSAIRALKIPEKEGK